MRYIVLLLLIITQCAIAQQKETLRLDYNFTGNSRESIISLSNVQTQGAWAGRNSNLSTLPAKAYIMMEISDESTDEVIYRTAGSTLYDEWRTTPEAETLTRSMPYTMLLPMPEKPAIIRLFQTNSRHDTIAQHTYRFDPSDILIRQAKTVTHPTRTILHNGEHDKCVDIVILAEGYTTEEREKFFADALRISNELFTYEPFNELKNRFNITAVAAPSEDSETSYPKEKRWANTLLGSHFSTFYSDRYLTVSDIPRVHDQLVGIPYDHIVVLVNTKTYGGGGFYNMLTLTAADNERWSQLFVHELCHGLIGLGDEYDYDTLEGFYHVGIEPYEQNLTTLTDFNSKWKDLYESGKASLVEGGGYMQKAVYRPAEDCMMRSFTHKDFCPVCQRTIKQYIEQLTK